MRRKSEEEVKRKIKELQKKLQQTDNPKERQKIRHAIFHYKHYNERLEDANKRKLRKRPMYIDDLPTLKDLKEQEEKPHGPRMYSSLEWELIESKRTQHIKLDTEDFKKYMRV